MDTVFMNSKNSKTSDPRRLLLNLANKMDLRRKDKNIALSDVSYSISDIQEYFEYILKKYEEKTGNPSIRVYTNKVENRITFKIKTGYYLEFLTPETMKLLGTTKGR